MFTEESIVQLFREGWTDSAAKDLNWVLATNGGISKLECALMYLYIRAHYPRHVVEFSPNHGYSTTAIGEALRSIHRRYSFGTFEIDPRFVEATICQMQKLGLFDEYVDVIVGDALIEIPKYLKRFGPNACDFCFIDSDHREEFATAYINNIFPLLTPGALVGIHDIAATQLNSQGQSTFRTSLQTARQDKFSGGEENPVRKYIEQNKLEYCVLHAITGGEHEGAKLPWNMPLLNELKSITGIDFKGKVCPKTLFLYTLKTNTKETA